MAQRVVKVGERITIRHGRHKGAIGTVVAHERREGKRPVYGWRGIPKYTRVSLLTYVVDLEGWPRSIRVPGSYLDLV